MILWGFLAVCLVAAAAVAVMAARRRFVVVKVAGMSMAPAFAPGDAVLARRRTGHQTRAGAAAVPLNVGFPPARTVQMIKAAGVLASVAEVRRVTASQDGPAATAGPALSEPVAPPAVGSSQVKPRLRAAAFPDLDAALPVLLSITARVVGLYVRSDTWRFRVADPAGGCLRDPEGSDTVAAAG